ncbi:MAG: FecR domain-containing protein [Nitrospinae bacterium]|nr:FecR domain-containing protein [Nitrospinota bacterium]
MEQAEYKCKCFEYRMVSLRGTTVPKQSKRLGIASLSLAMTRNIKIRLLISFILLFLFPTPSFADSSTGSEVGSFSKIEGRVDILKEGAPTTAPVKVNDNVSMGDIVRTKSDGKAEITFKDDTTVRLAPETRMKIDEYVFNPDNSRKTGALGLFRGKVRAVVSKTKGGIIPVGISTSSFNINTPTAIAGVKGTDFFVFYAQGMTGVIFKEGSGFVANPNMPDKIVNINAGQITFVAAPNAPPLTPRPASNIEMAQHSKDTTPAEKPKEKKEEGQKPKEEKSEVKEAKAEDKGDKGKEDKKDEGKSEVKEAKAEGKQDGGESEGEGETLLASTSEGTHAENKAGENQSEGTPQSPATEQAPLMTMADKPPPAMEAVSFSAVDMTMAGPDLMSPTIGGDLFGFAPPTDIGVIPDTIATTTTIPDISTLLPITETQPQTLKNTDVTVNVVFQ